ncbi:calcium-binding protein [Actinoplanes flavus]|uniref:Calcium-binding protein n=1 Tax=Actinoplanes flavus TaxID=2820290 RepID=A0ABS3UY62_9ACTN|nr:calcium-binding protein [Actinoplanes flavus]MBO3743522.1 calcium-binding protein [Actinoplanes flavus]
MQLFRIGMTLLAGIGVGVLAAPVAAQAASVGVASTVGTTVEYKAASGKANRVVVTTTDRAVVIDDKYPIKAGTGCKPVRGDKTKVTCVTDVVTARVRVFTYDKADRITNRTVLRLIAWAGSGTDTVYGGASGDYLYGQSGKDVLAGGGGNDRISGGTADDKLYGGVGNDFVSGDTGHDYLDGGAGNDHLIGFNGKDQVYGGAGDDLVDMHNTRISGDRDKVYGGPGQDTVSYRTYRTMVVVNLHATAGSGGNNGREQDTLAADFEIAYGGEGNDRLYGYDGNQSLLGWDGDDQLSGGAGNDVLSGGPGKDKLYGNGGDDRLDGRDSGDNTDADLLNGGMDGTPAGDLCFAYTNDVKQYCER